MSTVETDNNEVLTDDEEFPVVPTSDPGKKEAPFDLTEDKAPDEENEDDKVLDLTALTPTRKMVKLPTKDTPEGEQFELRLVEDFGIEKQQQLLSWSRRYQQLMNSDKDLTRTQREQLRWFMNHLFNAVLDAPKEKKDGMDDTVRGKVVTAFSVGPLLVRQEAQMEIIRRLTEKGFVSQEQVDEVMTEIRLELARLTMES